MFDTFCSIFTLGTLLLHAHYVEARHATAELRHDTSLHEVQSRGGSEERYAGSKFPQKIEGPCLSPTQNTPLIQQAVAPFKAH